MSNVLSNSFALVLATSKATMEPNNTIVVDMANNQQEEDFYHKMVKAIAKETSRKGFKIDKYYKNFQRIKELDERVGKSANDVVFCERRADNVPVVLKIKTVTPNSRDWADEYNHIKFEIYYSDKLCTKSHPNIIHITQFWIDEPSLSVYIEMEKCEQSLSAYVKKYNHQVDMRMCCSLLKQAVQALYFCHSHNVIHGDVKEANMLLIRDPKHKDERYILKLADFEHSREVGYEGKIPYTEQINDRALLPFEVLTGQAHLSYAVDMHALGCVFLTMIGGDENLFNEFDWQKQLNRINEHSGPISDALWASCNNHRKLTRPLVENVMPCFADAFPFLRNHDDCVEKFVKRLMDIDQTTRMTSFSAKHDPFFYVFKQY